MRVCLLSCVLVLIRSDLCSMLSPRWHRLAYSVEGQTVTLYLDCEKIDTLDLPRGYDPEVSTDGVTVFGTRLLDEEVFEVGKPECGCCLCVCVCVCVGVCVCVCECVLLCAFA